MPLWLIILLIILFPIWVLSDLLKMNKRGKRRRKKF